MEKIVIFFHIFIRRDFSFGSAIYFRIIFGGRKAQLACVTIFYYDQMTKFSFFLYNWLTNLEILSLWLSSNIILFFMTNCQNIPNHLASDLENWWCVSNIQLKIFEIHFLLCRGEYWDYFRQFIKNFRFL